MVLLLTCRVRFLLIGEQGRRRASQTFLWIGAGGPSGEVLSGSPAPTIALRGGAPMTSGIAHTWKGQYWRAAGRQSSSMCSPSEHQAPAWMMEINLRETTIYESNKTHSHVALWLNACRQCSRLSFRSDLLHQVEEGASHRQQKLVHRLGHHHLTLRRLEPRILLANHLIVICIIRFFCLFFLDA